MVLLSLTYSGVGSVCLFFFFQAEDGIRDVAVTGVQTCALPILHSKPARSPLALNAVVPCECAVASAERTGARSAAVISLSQPQPIEKLHTAPGNCRSASWSICPIFS